MRSLLLSVSKAALLQCQHCTNLADCMFARSKMISKLLSVLHGTVRTLQSLQRKASEAEDFQEVPSRALHALFEATFDARIVLYECA